MLNEHARPRRGVCHINLNKDSNPHKTSSSPMYLAAKLFGGHPRRSSIPGAHIQESARIGSGTAASGEAPREELLRAQRAGLGDPGNSFQLAVFPLKVGVQAQVDVFFPPYLRV